MNTLKPAKQLAKAIAIASASHITQFDRGGQPYILHPLRVMFRLRTDDHELMAIAVLHDVVEDDVDITIESLKAEGFSHRVTDALLSLTHLSEESYFDYIEAMANNKDALLVKKEDLDDNSRITRLNGVQQKDLDRIEKYHNAYLMVKKYLKAFDCSL